MSHASRLAFTLALAAVAALICSTASASLLEVYALNSTEGGIGSLHNDPVTGYQLGISADGRTVGLKAGDTVTFGVYVDLTVINTTPGIPGTGLAYGDCMQGTFASLNALLSVTGPSGGLGGWSMSLLTSQQQYGVTTFAGPGTPYPATTPIDTVISAPVDTFNTTTGTFPGPQSGTFSAANVSPPGNYPAGTIAAQNVALSTAAFPTALGGRLGFYTTIPSSTWVPATNGDVNAYKMGGSNLLNFLGFAMAGKQFLFQSTYTVPPDGGTAGITGRLAKMNLFTDDGTGTAGGANLALLDPFPIGIFSDNIIVPTDTTAIDAPVTVGVNIPVPEPGTMFLLLAGAVALVLARRRLW